MNCNQSIGSVNLHDIAYSIITIKICILGSNHKHTLSVEAIEDVR